MQSQHNPQSLITFHFVSMYCPPYCLHTTASTSATLLSQLLLSTPTLSRCPVHSCAGSLRLIVQRQLATTRPSSPLQCQCTAERLRASSSCHSSWVHCSVGAAAGLEPALCAGAALCWGGGGYCGGLALSFWLPPEDRLGRVAARLLDGLAGPVSLALPPVTHATAQSVHGSWWAAGMHRRLHDSSTLARIELHGIVQLTAASMLPNAGCMLPESA